MLRQAFMESALPNDPAAFRDDGIEFSIAGPPQPPANMTYKLKIIVSFLQISTGVSTALYVQWPKTFKTFISYFTVVNFDIISMSSFECLARDNYYPKYILWMCSIPIMILSLLILYLLPQFFKIRYSHASKWDQKVMQKETRQNFWKMLIYLLFCFYPGVSRTVCQFFICQKIYDHSYLRADLTKYCFDDEWNKFLPLATFSVFVYPIGIPLFFWYMLNRYKHRLFEPGVESQLGFLYAGYARSVWWFEAIDMTNKLCLTSLLWFFPMGWELAAGMTISSIYSCVVFVMKPYLRKGDDRLQLIANVEIYLMMLVGYVFKNEVELDAKTDITLSAIMITITGTLFLYFVIQSAQVFRRWYKEKQLDEVADISYDEEEADAASAVSDPENTKTAKFVYDNTLGFDEPSQVNLGPRLVVISGMNCQNVKNADSGGKSDPFVRMNVVSRNGTVLMDKEEFKSQTIKDSLNPVWGEEWEVMLTEDSDHIVFEIYDDDLFGQSDYLGEVKMRCKKLIAGQTTTERIVIETGSNKFVPGGVRGVFMATFKVVSPDKAHLEENAHGEQEAEEETNDGDEAAAAGPDIEASAPAPPVSQD